MSKPPPPELARQLVATLLGRPAASLGETLPAAVLREPREAATAERSLAGAVFHVVDLETTGLSKQGAHILEIGAVRVEGAHTTARFQELVRPPEPIPPRISRLTGIEDAAVRDASPLGPVLGRFRDWLAERPEAGFVAHNARFDEGFVERDLAAQGLPGLDGPTFCTRRLGRRLVPELGRYNLDQLSAHFGISNAGRHRALGDALATAKIWLELMERCDARGLETVGDLLDLQEAPPPKRQA
ncbi:MAG: 3'-5' exonuclease [Proteobacteria bacterium]|nr:3'-5' exonuclease [Pseudomonadota bacterium]